MSRVNDIITRYGGLGAIQSLPPETQLQVRNELLEARRQDQMSAESEAKGSTSQDLLSLGGSIGGIWAGNQLGSALWGGGSSAASAGGATATGAGALPAVPNVISATQAAPGVSSASGAAGGIGTLGSLGMGAGIAAGTYLTAEGIKDALANKETKSPKDWLSRAQAAASTFGFSEVGRALGLGHQSTKQYQDERSNKLLKKVPTYEGFYQQLKANEGRGQQASQNAAADFVGVDNGGTWVNNRFRDSNDVKDLKAEDIWGSQAMFEKYGDDWLGKMTEEQRRAEAQKALDSGAVSTKKGMINVDWSKVGAPQQSPSMPTRDPRLVQQALQNIAKKKK